MKFLTEQELNQLTDQRLKSLLNSVKDKFSYIRYVKLPDILDGLGIRRRDHEFLKKLKEYRYLIISIIKKRSLS